MKQTLIEQLYTKDDCKYVKQLYKEDPSSRTLLKEAIANKILLDKHKFLFYRPLDVICMICLNSEFSSSDDESYRVAVTLYQYLNKPNNFLPSIVEDRGLNLANKSLISLSLYYPALEKRWKYHGAPSPLFYRKMSKTIFRNLGQNDIAIHHENWEKFINEYFV